MNSKILLYLFASLLFACAHPQRPVQPVAASRKSVPAAKKVGETGPRPAAKVFEDWELLQLDSAATALRVIYDQSLEASSAEAQAILGCEIKGEEAMGLMMPLKALIDEKLPRELKAYLRQPKTYAQEHQFATCQALCHCGLYASLLESAVVKPGEKQWHRTTLKTLQAKAEALTPDMALKCAQEQRWVCQSDLLQKLRQDSGLD